MGHLQISFMQRALMQWNRHLEQLKLQRLQHACASQFPAMSQQYEGGSRQGQPLIAANGGVYAAPLQQYLQQSTAQMVHSACNAHISTRPS